MHQMSTKSLVLVQWFLRYPVEFGEKFQISAQFPYTKLQVACIASSVCLAGTDQITHTGVWQQLYLRHYVIDRRLVHEFHCHITSTRFSNTYWPLRTKRNHYCYDKREIFVCSVCRIYQDSLNERHPRWLIMNEGKTPSVARSLMNDIVVLEWSSKILSVDFQQVQGPGGSDRTV